MDQIFYKKTGLMTTVLARILLVREVGDQSPTIVSCVDEYHVSRGVVQDSFAILENSGCLKVERHGKNGNIITQLDKNKLLQYVNLNPMCASMPVPLNDSLGSLATAVCRCMSNAPVPFTFAFIEGAANRVAALRRMTYDFIFVSGMSAKMYVEQYPELEVAMILNQCLYCNEYLICINSSGAHVPQKGMTIGCDPSCSDQYRLTQQISDQYHLNMVNIPYMSCVDALLAQEVDVIIYRNDPWIAKHPEISTLPVEDQEYSLQDMTVPVILTNRQNYGISDLLNAFLCEEQLRTIQQLVMDHKMRPQYF